VSHLESCSRHGGRQDLILEHTEELVAAPFQSLDDIAAAANDSEYGLGAGIWTRDISKAHALAKKLRAGTVWINCYNVFDASLPFGGYKQSGWGREMGHEALEAYTEVKAVTTQL
jgi:phenylacetaldehyde dehydrogenase